MREAEDEDAEDRALRQKVKETGDLIRSETRQVFGSAMPCIDAQITGIAQYAVQNRISDELVRAAIIRAGTNGARNLFAYVTKLLCSWLEADIYTGEQLAAYEYAYRAANDDGIFSDSGEGLIAFFNSAEERREAHRREA